MTVAREQSDWSGHFTAVHGRVQALASDHRISRASPLVATGRRAQSPDSGFAHATVSGETARESCQRQRALKQQQSGPPGVQFSRRVQQDCHASGRKGGNQMTDVSDDLAVESDDSASYTPAEDSYTPV